MICINNLVVMMLFGFSIQLLSVNFYGFVGEGRKKSKSEASDSNEEGLSQKELALQQALDQITASFGKGSIMWLGRSVTPRNVPVVSTGSFSLDIALGIGGFPKVLPIMDLFPLDIPCICRCICGKCKHLMVMLR